MKRMCPVLISPSVFGEVPPQTSLPDEVISRFDSKGASNLVAAETTFHSKLRLWTKSRNKTWSVTSRSILSRCSFKEEPEEAPGATVRSPLCPQAQSDSQRPSALPSATAAP